MSELNRQNRIIEVLGKRPFLTGPQADGGLSVYGVCIAGTWEKEVERVLCEKKKDE